MRINVSAVVVETPEKAESAADSVSPARADDKLKERASPSEGLRVMLKGIERLHTFCHSSSESLDSIENIRLQIKTKDLICEIFNGYQDDLKDWILDKEKQMTEIGKFSSFCREFIHVQFCVAKDYSFSVLVLINYMQRFHLTLETAFVELFKMCEKSTFCSRCNDENVRNIQQENLKYLRILIASDDSEDTELEDSDRDSVFDYHKELQIESVGISEKSCVLVAKVVEPIKEVFKVNKRIGEKNHQTKNWKPTLLKFLLKIFMSLKIQSQL